MLREDNIRRRVDAICIHVEYLVTSSYLNLLNSKRLLGRVVRVLAVALTYASDLDLFPEKLNFFQMFVFVTILYSTDTNGEPSFYIR